jgi:AraC-like DNA-binding protein
MIQCRPARPALRPFISLLWATDASRPVASAPTRERVLPTGVMHIVIRLGDNPLRLFADPTDREGDVVGACVIGGVRNTAYIKCIAKPGPMIGAMLRTGTVDPLSNTPAGALAGRHTRLEDLWCSSEIAELRERLEAAPTLALRLTVFEEILSRRLSTVRAVDPLISRALFRFDHGVTVAEAVSDSGFSHRHFVRSFTAATGLLPKTYLRLKRFNRTVQYLNVVREAALADVAAAMGYADQSHMTREFQAFAGLSPGHYRRIAPAEARHVPLTA